MEVVRLCSSGSGFGSGEVLKKGNCYFSRFLIGQFVKNADFLRFSILAVGIR